MLAIIKQFVRRMLMGKGAGIPKIPPQKAVDDFANDLYKKFKQNGVSDEAITNPKDVKIVWEQITNREAQIFNNNLKDALQKPDPFKKAGEVVDLTGKKIPSGSQIMGGEEVIVDVVGDTVTNMKAMTPMDAMKEANLVIARKGKYKNLTIDESQDILKKTNDHIFERDIKYDEFGEIIKPDPEDLAGGGVAGLLGEPTYEDDNHRVPYAEGSSWEQFQKEKTYRLWKEYQQYLENKEKENKQRPYIEERMGVGPGPILEAAEGGRIGFGLGGISRRAFLKWMASGAAGIGAAKSGLFSLLKGGGKKQVIKELASVPINNIEGMPVWFKPLVNKVIKEGDDVTKKFATKDREIVHRAQIDKDASVDVIQDLDTGNVRLEYDAADNLGYGPIQLDYKAGEVIEQGSKRGTKTKPEFSAVESEPRITNWDGDIEFDGENIVNVVDDLLTDTTKLETYATGKNPNIKKLLKSEQKKKYVNKLNDDQMEQLEYIENKHGMSADDYIDEGARVGDFDPKGYRDYNTKGINLPDKIKKASGGRVPLAEGGDPGTAIAEEVREAWKDYLKEKGTGTFKGSWKEFQPIWIRANLASGGRVPLGKGGVLKGLAWLANKIAPGSTKIGQTSKIMAPKTELKRSIAGFQEREAAAKLKPGKDELIIKNHTWDPKTGEDTSTWKIYKKSDKNRPPTEYEIEDYMDELPHGGELGWTDFGNTIDELDNAVAEAKDYERYMYDQYKTGKLDKYMSMEAKGKRVLDADDAGRPSGYNMDEEYEIRAAMDEAERIKIAKWRAKEELAKSKESPWFTDSKTLTPEDELRKEFPGIDDKMIRNILTDKNPQRIAEVKATMKEALKMQQKGMGHEEIINMFKKTKPTKHATGGRAEFIFGGSTGLRALWKRMMKTAGPQQKTLFPRPSRKATAIGKFTRPQETESIESLNLQQLENMLDALKTDKKSIAVAAESKAMRDPGLDFLMGKMKEDKSWGLDFDQLAKYTDIDNDIMIVEQMVKNKTMKGRKPNATGGRASLSAGGIAGMLGE